jgi:FSR family fosmidomycin resistance protein-like MFS transporter
MRAFIQAYRDVPGKAYFSALSHFALEIHNNVLPVLFPILIATLGLSYAQVGTINLVGVMAGTLTQPLFGWLSDRWDPRWMTVISILWMGMWTGLFGLAPSFTALIVIVGIAKLGTAAYHPAGASMARATAGVGQGASMAVFSVNGNLGYALSPVIASLVVDQWFGMRGTLVFPVTALALAGLLFWRFQHFDIKTSQEVRAESATVPVQQTGSAIALALVILMVASRSWYQGSLNTFLPSWYQEQGFSVAQAGQLFALLLLSVGAGSLLGGGVSDRTGNLPIVVISLAVMMPALWFFLIAPFWVQIPLLVLIGIGIGASFPVSIVMAQNVWPQGPGLASALVIGIGWLPTGLGTVIMGTIADRTSLTEALRYLVYAPLVGLAAALVFWLYSWREDSAGG